MRKKRSCQFIYKLHYPRSHFRHKLQIPNSFHAYRCKEYKRSLLHYQHFSSPRYQVVCMNIRDMCRKHYIITDRTFLSLKIRHSTIKYREESLMNPDNCERFGRAVLSWRARNYGSKLAQCIFCSNTPN